MVEAIGVAWIYGLKKFIQDIKFMLNISIGIYWKFCWGFFTPLALFGIFVYSVATYTPLTYQGQLYPAHYEYAGYALILLAIAQVFLLVFFFFFFLGGIGMLFCSAQLFSGPGKTKIHSSLKRISRSLCYYSMGCALAVLEVFSLPQRRGGQQSDHLLH